MNKVDKVFKKIMNDILTEATIKNANSFGAGSVKRTNSHIDYTKDPVLADDRFKISQMLHGKSPIDLNPIDIGFVWCKPEINATVGSATFKASSLAGAVHHWITKYKSICSQFEDTMKSFHDMQNENKKKAEIGLDVEKNIAKSFPWFRIGQVYGLMMDALYHDQYDEMEQYNPMPRTYSYHRVDLNAAHITEEDTIETIAKKLDDSNAIKKINPAAIRQMKSKNTYVVSTIPDELLLTQDEVDYINGLMDDHGVSFILTHCKAYSDGSKINLHHDKWGRSSYHHDQEYESTKELAEDYVENDRPFAVVSTEDFKIGNLPENTIKLSMLLDSWDAGEKYTSHKPVTFESLGCDRRKFMFKNRQGKAAIKVFVKDPEKNKPKIETIEMPSDALR